MGWIMWNKLSVLLLILLVLAPVTAQDEPPLPVLNAEDIFAEGVQKYVETLPILSINNDERIAYYFDPAKHSWEQYPFPDEVEIFGRWIDRRSDNTFLVYVTDNVYSWFRTYFVGNNAVWAFNSEIGFYQPESVCGLITSLPNEGKWRFTQIEGKYHLCNTETGQLSSYISYPYSLDFNDCILDYFYDLKISISPSNRWIIFPTCYERTSGISIAYVFSIFAYDIEQDRFYSLGLTDYSSYLRFKWVDDNTALIFGYANGLDGEARTYTASKEFVQARATLYQAIFDNSNAPHMNRLLEANTDDFYYSEQSSTINWIEQNSIPRYVVTYHLDTQVIERRFPLECDIALCIILFEFDNLLWITTDNRAVGEISSYYIFNQETGDLLLQGRAYPYSLFYAKPQEQIIFYTYDAELRRPTITGTNLSTLEQNTLALTAIDLDGVATKISPDRRYWIIMNNVEAPHVSIFDRETELIIPIITNRLPNNLRFSMTWDFGNILQIEARDMDNDTSGWGRVIQSWRIRIDALNEAIP
jgi:hypothetical protein